MGQNSRIEWTDHTFNPWWGCDRVRHWNEPRMWNRRAEKAGVRQRVFCGSMCDVWEDRPDLEKPRAQLFDLISECTELDWLLLTKRPENIQPILERRYFEDQEGWADPILLPNVGLGVTVESNAQRFRILTLLQLPANLRFVSYEPALGPLDMRRIGSKNALVERDEDEPGIDWVIAGGETGPGARPAHPDWFRMVRDQCAAAGIPFFFKQWGEWVPTESISEACLCAECRAYLREYTFSDGSVLYKVGKKKDRRLLDGREHSDFPHA